MDQHISHFSVITGISGGVYAPVPALPVSLVRSKTP
jgi:hypothetical protein|tara:strand:+ start:2686 stop:2793 length:108 start_codon:yes stop_codon:yes gene_type:complete